MCFCRVVTIGLLPARSRLSGVYSDELLPISLTYNFKRHAPDFLYWYLLSFINAGGESICKDSSRCLRKDTLIEMRV